MLNELSDALKLFLDSQGVEFGVFDTPIPGMMIGHAEAQKLPDYAIYRPTLGVVVQGAKQVWLGEQVLDYHEGEALLVSVSLLAKGVITQASAEKPFLGVTIELDTAVLREVGASLAAPPEPAGASLSVHALGPEALDCLVRLARLLNTPDAMPVLYPGMLRELSYWLLKGETGADLWALTKPEGMSDRIENALALLRTDFAAPILVEDLAATAGMGLTSFHRHFKALTRLTPIQYQKQLRLVEARKILDAGTDNVTGAAFAVGYESAAQFSRDYSRFYGLPPKRDTLARRLGIASASAA
ncbi:AraC family transcriptional regulator [Devosia yakushimensis]|uniref:AraC family transcriptional regulator n=1 Tax=Devosia yakushimensis TaxID=470028 RepID=A0ABQ5UJ56_9HYPH|nr:AraC family transcriptional regulator [Devosia yakushimensis]GLQ12082.1 AraC family transcriptional regulator [Devosia yakushimensis]